MDGLAGAFLGTFAASGALVIIDDRYIVVHMDGIMFTLLYAKCASYTSGLAHTHNILASCMAGAYHLDRLSVRNKSDDMLGTGLNAGLTCGTLLFIYYSNTVDKMDGVKLAHINTGTVAHTSETASLVIKTGNNGKRGTVLNSRILVLLYSLVAGT